MSGLANWKQFQLTHTPVLLCLPAEVLKAYRLTFFVDNTDPISARIKKIVAELDELRAKLPPEELVEAPVAVVDTPVVGNYSAIDTGSTPESETAIKQPVEKGVVPSEPESLEETVIPSGSGVDRIEPEQLPLPEKAEERTEDASPIHIVPQSLAVRVDNNLAFKITIPSLPASARAKQRKSQAAAAQTNGASDTDKVTAKQKRKGMFEQFAQALGFPAEGKRGKAYYQKKGEAIQNDFQDKLSKLEKDYNEGYGLNLMDWDPRKAL